MTDLRNLNADQRAMAREAVAAALEEDGLTQLATRVRRGEVDTLPIVRAAFAAASAVAAR